MQLQRLYCVYNSDCILSITITEAFEHYSAILFYECFVHVQYRKRSSFTLKGHANLNVMSEFVCVVLLSLLFFLVQKI